MRWRNASMALALVACSLAPTSAFAAAPSDRSSVEQCITRTVPQGQHAMTLKQARVCAPTGATVIKSSRGYVIAQVTTQPAQVTTQPARALQASSGTSCAWRWANLYDVGFTDWLGGRFCWNDNGITLVNGPHEGCGAYGLGASCDYHYSYVSYTSQLYIEMTGIYFNHCALWFTCNTGIGMRVWVGGFVDQWWWDW